MAKRDEYVERVKKRLDDWNADIKKLEDAYEKAETGARLRLKEQIESLRHHREQALATKHLDEEGGIWQGAEEAWRRIGDVFAGYRSTYGESFAEKSPPGEKSAVETPSADAPAKKKAPAGKSSKKSATKSS